MTAPARFPAPPDESQGERGMYWRLPERSTFSSWACEHSDHAECSGMSEALDSPHCGCGCHSPEPQPDRAALVERLRTIAQVRPGHIPGDGNEILVFRDWFERMQQAVEEAASALSAHDK